MNTQNQKTKNSWIGAIKIFLASLSITSLIGLWNLFSKSAQDESVNPEGSTTSNADALNTPLPTIVPSTQGSMSSGQSDQNLTQVSAQEAQPTAAPVVEQVVIGSTGSSRSGSSSSRTSSSR